MDDIIKPSDFMNEMAVSTGAIPLAPLGGTGFKKKISIKKKHKPKSKSYKASPITGKPNQGEVLYSGIETKKHIKEANRPRKRRPFKRPDPKKQEKITIRSLTPKSSWAAKNLPAIFRTGGVEELKGANPAAEFSSLNRRIEGNTNLKHSRVELRKIVETLRGTMLSRARSAGGSENYPTTATCLLTHQFATIENILAGKVPNTNPEEPWDPPISDRKGLDIQRPPAGWWGIRNWRNATAISRYNRIYVNLIYFKYLQQTRAILEHHDITCEGLCKDNSHINFIVSGYCGGFTAHNGTNWTLEAALKQLASERTVDFAIFKKRAVGKVRPESPEQSVQSRKRSEEIKQKEGLAASLRQVDPFDDYAASLRRLFGVADDDDDDDDSNVDESKISPEISKIIKDL